MRSILLTGATGLVGRATVHEAKAQGVDLVTLTRSGNRLGSTNFVFDAMTQDWTALHAVLNRINPDVIIHLAAYIPPPSLCDEEACRIVNERYTLELVRWINTRQKSVRLIFMSSTSVYGQPQSVPITTDHPTEPSHVYSRSKLRAERSIKEQLQHDNWLIFRLSSPVPPSLDELPQTVLRHWILQAKSGTNLEVHGTGERQQDFISTIDCAQAVLFAAESDVRGIHNLGSGKSVSMIELASFLAKWYQVMVDQKLELNGGSEVWDLELTPASLPSGFPSYSGLEVIEYTLKTSK